MKIGAVYPQLELGGDPEAVRRFGIAAEVLGYDHLLAYDHVVGATHDREPKLWGPYTDKSTFHDPFMMFAYLAGLTERIEFVTGVMILPQRQTVLVAKQAGDLDLLSRERFRLGVGVGWNYVEYEALGQDFATRGRRIDEQIGLLRRLWTEPLVSFEGEFDRIDRGNINPRPKRQVPIWIGGFSDVAFRRAAKFGDGFIFAGTLDDCIEGLGRVKHYLAEEGRSLDGFGTDFLNFRTQSVDGAVDDINRWEDAGGTHASVVTMGMGLSTTEAHVNFISEVRARVVSRLGRADYAASA